MDTPYTIRAQELRDIYNSICMKYLTQDERLDVLLTLKHTVKVGRFNNKPEQYLFVSNNTAEFGHGLSSSST